jgi:AraC family transcriptional regulator, regulatory protein of adaptative response / DNA-3-methyladenine glycosylase II
MLLDRTAMEKARQTRDPRFDGRFFVGVRTTGVYCRPICPVRIQKRDNVEFYTTAAAATAAGYRPCLRCRPEAAPGTPAWNGTATTVVRALRLIEQGALDEASLESFAERLGVTSRHLRRLFMRHVGATPSVVAQTRRLQLAKKLVDETGLPLTELALAAGYGSVRRFNDHFRSIYGRSPRDLRRRQGRKEQAGLTLSLSYRAPYDLEGVMSFLSARAIPGVESVDDGCYRRTVLIDGVPGHLLIWHRPDSDQFLCRIETAGSASLIGVTDRVRRLFDLDAMPDEISGGLAADPGLKPLVNQCPGIRVPGTWDPFEVAVRAIVGQQVSVAGATTIMGRLAARLGTVSDSGLLFPTPAQLAQLVPEDLPMPRSRAMAIRTLAEHIRDGQMDFGDDPQTLRASLLAIHGIGEWTAQYIIMRACDDPDAFPINDLVLLKMARQYLDVSDHASLSTRSEHWRPWRAYACVHLWRAASRASSSQRLPGQG